MHITTDKYIPKAYTTLEGRCEELGFTMPSDVGVGRLLKTLVASKPAGNFLELGTGIGLSLSWMLDGMDAQSRITSLDNDPKLIDVVSQVLELDKRLHLLCQDGESWIESYTGTPFDLIFADSWPGKYNHLDETIALLAIGGFYIIDDMLPQENWPEGHEEKANTLLKHLQERSDLSVSYLDWSTGILVATRIR